MEYILIGVLGVLGGATIGVLGQIIGNLINHKKEIERIRNESILKEKIESFKKIYKISYEIKRKMIDFLMKKEEEKSYIKDLISELNNEAFLFSNIKTLKEIKESVDSMHDILDNPPKTVKIKDNKVYINQEELKKVVKQMGDIQTKIILSIKKELKIK